MLSKIIDFSIKNKFIIGLLTLGFIVYGALQVSKLPVDAVPDITDNQVQVITVTPSLGAPDVERLITFPVEQSCSNIPGIKEIRSFSRFGLSLVTIVFGDEVDVYWARTQVNERLKMAENQIPAGIGTPELAPVTTGLGEIFQYAVRPKKGYEGKYDARELRTIQDWIIRRQLLGTPGVADVSSFGGFLKQYEIAVNPDKLKSYRLTVSDVFAALENNNQNTGGSYIEKGPSVLFIRSEGLVKNTADIENIAVKQINNVPLLIRDIAEIKIGNATRYGAMTYNDEGEVAGAVVMMLKGENSSKVIKNVKERIAKIEKTLPEGVIIEPFLDRTKMVNNAIGTVERNLLEGALIVVFVLVLFLGNFRAGLVVASVIPLSMLFAVIMMNLFGVSGNLMSLGAIDFGLIVDGAVIIVEAVMHRLHHNKKMTTARRITQQQMDKEVSHSSGRMMNAAVFGQIIILIVYLPILTLQGIEGKMFRPMAQTVSFAILGAFILSITYVPMMSALFLSKKISTRPNLSDRIMNRLENVYQWLLIRVIQFKKTVLLSAIILFAGAVFLLTLLGGEFIPELEEGDFAVDTRVLTGSNLNTTIDATQQTAKVLLNNFPEVEKIVTKIGSGEIPTDPMPIEASDMMVILKNKKEWKSAKTFDELAEKMNEKLSDIPGVTAGFQYPVQMRFNELMTGARQDVVCKIFGEDLDTLAVYAKKLGDIINTVNGTRDLYIETVTGMPQILINYNREAIAKFGLSVMDINRTVNTAFAGQTAGLVYEGEKRFNLVLRLADNLRKDIIDVQNLLIATPAGAQIPLYQLADVKIEEGPNQIQREDAKRRIVTGFNVRGRDVQSIVKELQQKVGMQILFPPGYYVTYGGAFENLVEAKQRLSIAVPVALLLIFLMLYFAFGSFKQGLLIYSAIPLSAIGGIISLWARDMPFSISAGIGFIALFGVAVLNGIVLITEFNRLKKEGMEDIKQIVLEGTKIRLRPVLMTAAVASLGFMPMALSSGAGAEVQRPLATVVIGGLATATLLTLFVLPVLYLFFNNTGKQKKKIISATGIILLVLSFSRLQAQQNKNLISLDEALQLAVNNNLNLQANKLELQSAGFLVKTAADIPKTNILADYGQINSINNDTRFSLAQTINWPKVYTRQKEVHIANQRVLQTNYAGNELLLKAEVKRLYYWWLMLDEKEKLLQEADSIYAAFLTKAELRLKKGETNILEKTSAQSHRSRVILQLQQIISDKEVASNQFNLLLNSKVFVIPQAAKIRYEFIPVMDTNFIEQTPFVMAYRQKADAALANVKLEIAKLSPDIVAGYNNMSIIGIQNINGADVNFKGSRRFSAVTAGVLVPLFTGAQKNRIQAAKTNRQLAQTQTAAFSGQLKTQYRNEYVQFIKNLAAVQHYESILLKDAGIILNTAAKQFEAGEINYLEWTILLNQSISIRSDYLDAVHQLNQNLFQLELFSKQ